MQVSTKNFTKLRIKGHFFVSVASTMCRLHVIKIFLLINRKKLGHARFLNACFQELKDLYDDCLESL